MKTVHTTIAVLRQFTAADPELGVSEVARRTGLDKASAHRVLKALADERMVEQDAASKRYRLGLGVLDFAAVRMSSFGFLADAAAEIRALAASVEESIAIHALDGHEMVCLDFVACSHPVGVAFFVGERFPAHVTSAGLAALSTLSRPAWAPLLETANRASGIAVAEAQLARTLDLVRREGCSVVDQSYERGVRAVAVPVVDEAGEVVCTLSVAAPAQRRTVTQLKAMTPRLLDAAARLRRSVGGGRPAILRRRAES